MRYLAILLTLVSTSIYSQIIDKINIIGNNTIDKGTILSYTPFEDGDFYTKEIGDNIKKQLFVTGFFKDVLITDVDNILNIEVIENPTIREVKLNLDGDDLINEDKIKENLEKLGVYQGIIYNELKLVEFTKQIKKAYTTGGYVDAQVDYKVDIDSDNLATISLDIAENEITKINAVNISGNSAFTTDELLDIFTIGEADMFLINFFTKRDEYSKIELDSSIDKLNNFYLDNGYLDFKVKDVKIKQVDKKININIVINEGNIYKIGSINFTGTSENLTNQLSLKTGDIFKRTEVVKSVKNITNYFADKGHAFFKIETKTDKVGSLINLTFDINKNQKVYINRITITGNTRTEDSVLRREIGLLEGGLYNNAELDKSIKRLKRLGFFKDVSMKVSKVAGSSDRLNLHFEVVEDKTGRFSIGVSHSNATGAAFNAGIKENNIFGTGNILQAEFSNSKAVQNLDLYFSNPYFNKKEHSISYGIFSKSVDGAELESSDYVVDKTGLSFGYGVPLDEESRIKLDVRLSNTDITCSTTFAGSGYEEKQCADDLSSEFLTSIAYSQNTLNNFYFPTDGDNLNVKLSAALPVLDYSYYKLDTNYKKYVDLGDDLTFKFKTNIGIASGLSGEELPFFERYYGGGSSSVRGFKFNSFGAKYPDDRSKGGELSVLTSFAIISPLGWVKDSNNMRISAFVDIGGVYETTSDFSVDELRASVGLAFVWVTPIGPLGLYAATPLKKKDGDDTKTIDFTLGTTF